MAGQRVFTGAVFLAIALCCLVSSSLGTTLNLQNQCADTITVYSRAGSQPTADTHDVATGGSFALDVGATWNAGVVWAENPNNALATQAEFTIGENGVDTYDISLVNAYNLGVEIHPITPSGSTCDDIECTIAGLQGFCTGDNKYTAAGDGTAESCTNTDGPQQPEPACCCPTDNTKIFKNACEDAFSFSTDNQGSQFTCNQGSTDYNVIFCPSGTSSDHGNHCPNSSSALLARV